MQTEKLNQNIFVKVYYNSKAVFSTDFSTRIELGRQQIYEPEPYLQIGNRVVIASLSQSEISRRHVLAEKIGSSKIRIANQSSVNPILIGDSEPLAPKSTRELELPIVVAIGSCVLEFDLVDKPLSEYGILDSLPTSPIPPGMLRKSSAPIDEILPKRSQKETDFLVNGLHLLNGFFQQASNPDDFFSQAVEGMIDVAGFETAAVLLFENDSWKTEAIKTRSSTELNLQQWAPSQTVLKTVLSNRKTFWNVPKSNDDAVPSLRDIKAVIASPLLTRDGDVVGVIYGDRIRDKNGKFDFEISEVDAVLVETLASGLAAGLARIKHQQKADKTRVLFEQFFTPELTRELESTPDLLVGKDEEVSLLFCEIQGFSEFSEKLGARLTLDWINDAMGTLSDCIADYDGTLVDMMGDELIGMWGAPKDCPEHAVLACRAAIKMFQQLAGLNRRWQKALEKPMNLAIGIHSGTARVGNIGSTRKFKYGPLGKTVRVAIQTQRMTKQLATKIMITGETKSYLGDEFATRQLNDLIDKQSSNSFEMFEIMADPPEDWTEMKRRYEAAVEAYNKEDFPTAVSLLAKILTVHPGDLPSIQLMSLINQNLIPKPWTI